MPGRTKTCLNQWSTRMIARWPRGVGRPDSDMSDDSLGGCGCRRHRRSKNSTIAPSPSIRCVRSCRPVRRFDSPTSKQRHLRGGGRRRIDLGAVSDVQRFDRLDAERLGGNQKTPWVRLECVDAWVLGRDDDGEAVANAERFQLSLGRIVGHRPEHQAPRRERIERVDEALTATGCNGAQRCRLHPALDGRSDDVDVDAGTSGGVAELLASHVAHERRCRGAPPGHVCMRRVHVPPAPPPRVASSMRRRASTASPGGPDVAGTTCRRRRTAPPGCDRGGRQARWIGQRSSGLSAPDARRDEQPPS